VRFAGANLLILSLLYCDVAGILRTTAGAIRLKSAGPGLNGPLPNHWVLENLFEMFGLFGGISHESVYYYAMGSARRLAVAPPEPTPDMVDLDIYQYFDFTLGEANRRVLLMSYEGESERLRDGYRHMAQVLMDRHNRANPWRKVEQVFIYARWWPKSPRGYFAEYSRHQGILRGHN
jgi:hypothetical protein